jgi:hypothetical protein
MSQKFNSVSPWLASISARNHSTSLPTIRAVRFCCGKGSQALEARLAQPAAVSNRFGGLRRAKKDCITTSTGLRCYFAS